MTKTARVYKIEMLIRNRGHVSFQALLDELEVSPATLKRDLDYLKDQLGAPIQYDRFLNGYRFGEEYRGQKHELPGLWFSEQELYSLLMAHQLLSELDSEGVISRHLQPLLDRIHQMLGTSDTEAKALLKRVKIIGSAKRPVSSQFFELIGEALLKRRRLHMRYLILLRTDVHTLFDLHLLGIDASLRVHLKDSIRSSEFARFHGKRIETLPSSTMHQPSPVALQDRFQKFLAASS